MEDDDHSSHSSADSDHDQDNDNEQDEVMEDAVDGDNGGDQDDDVNNDDDDNDNDNDNDDQDGDNDGDDGAEDNKSPGALDKGKQVDDATHRSTANSASFKIPLRPTLRPEALTAKLYDIVPTMAAPQATSINAMAITPDLRYWFTGGSDGYVRKYDGPGTINGKLALTVAQRHPFVDSVTKAGILMSYWENEEPAVPGKGETEHVLSPVYSLAVHSQALWLLSGLESGGINLQSVRHDEGKRIACLQRHTSAVSVLAMAPDEKSVLSGGWDKNIFDWDLDMGTTKRSFDGSGGQISSIELRPASGLPVPAGADEPVAASSTTISTNNGAPMTNGNFVKDETPGGGLEKGTFDDPATTLKRGDDEGSPAHDSLFGGSDAGSLFGETEAEQPFGQDDDVGYGGDMGMMGSQEGGMDHSADMAMAGIGDEPAPAPAAEEEKTGDQGDATAAVADSQDQASATADMHLDDPSLEEKQKAAEDPSSLAQNDTQKSEAPQGSAAPSETQPQEATAEETQQEEPASPSQKNETTLDPTSQQPGAAGFSTPSPPQASSEPDPSQVSTTTFLSSTINGTFRIWDRRAPNPVASIGTRPGVPPWCMSAVWSPDGNMIYAGRRNGTVEEFDVRKAKRFWEPERTLRFPLGSGPVSALKPMANGRHLVCASHDILRLYDLQESKAFKHSTVPFLIIPGPPRGGVISSLYIDPTSRFMLSAAGTRGWEGTCTETLIGYEIGVDGS